MQKQTHKTIRLPPPGQAIYVGNGWMRKASDDGESVVWKMWARVNGEWKIHSILLTLDMIGYMGRAHAARMIRSTRNEMFGRSPPDAPKD
jgi:hypothetical protein